MHDVNILGCGPAGLLAAHAVAEHGLSFKIFSKKRKSFLYGAQFLAYEVPGLNLEFRQTFFQQWGKASDYAIKVYGQAYHGPLNPILTKAWDIRDAYRKLWDLYSDRIENVCIDPKWVVNNLPDAAFTFSTIPAPALCTTAVHTFGVRNIWVAGDAPDRGQFVSIECPEDTVIVNAFPEPAWYKVSKVFGYKTVEWPDGPIAPDEPGVVHHGKPLFSNCTCWPNIIRTGRFGRWNKGVLAHAGYFDVKDVLERRKTAADFRPHEQWCPVATSGDSNDGCTCYLIRQGT